MKPGEVLAGRFVLGDRAGMGGMSEIYRATDLVHGQDVAVKLLHDPRGAGEPRLQQEQRFQREARLLEELAHPRIVRYVAHGASPSGAPYLVVEWLDGEDLSRTLARGRLGVTDSVAIARGVAEALAAAHARDIVHRDLKPSNVFLEHASPAEVKLLDFGIAWLGARTRITRTGALIGTPGYMAPEQVRSMGAVDARADVFALGCVLFECLAGEPPFRGDNLMSVLAKILCDEPPRLSELRDDVPEALAVLCARMLGKDPAGRPPDGHAAAAELSAIELGDELVAGVGHTAPARPAALTATERRAAAVLLVGADPGAVFTEAETLPGAVFEEASALGAQVEPLHDAAAVLTMQGRGAATDLAAQAAGTALALRARLPARPMALSLGWRGPTEQVPLRDAIDRAAGLLDAPAPDDAGAVPIAPVAPIAIDELVAGLLDARFDVREHADRFFLVGEREIVAGGRTLLGKPTSCVGRDGELRSLLAMFDACVDEPAARAVLVTAPPGVGKSRLGQEFLRQLPPSAAIWISRGDSLRARSPFGLLAQAIKSACGIHEGEPLAARHDKLLAQLARLGSEDRRRTAELVGEIIGAPFPDHDSPWLRAARRDAQLMHEHLQRGFVELVRTACAAGPVVVVLEDLHWGDAATASFLDAALRQLAGEPLFVLALARPEIAELFPRLWAERGVHELRLKELGRKACERLARQVLGEAASAPTIERIIALSDGNAFYLEELIRAATDGRKATLPQTVVAMVQSRLSKLDGETRRLLRAASVFGETCWASGVAALVGQPSSAALAALAAQELLVKRPDSRFAGEDELAFRHALLREGAYAMLTDADRATGHRLAGQWLEDHRETDPLVLAEHFDQGGEEARAARHRLRAAELAHRSDDLETALSLLDRRLSSAVPADLQLAYLGLRCEIGSVRLDITDATLTAAERLMREAPPGSWAWTQGVIAAMVHTQLARHDEFEAALERLVGVEPTEETIGLFGFALFVGVYCHLQWGHLADRAALLARARAALDRHGAHEPYLAGFLHQGLSMFHLSAREEPWTALVHIDAARRSFLRAEHPGCVRGATLVRGLVLWTLGATRHAEDELLGVAGADDRYGGLSSFRPFTLAHLACEREDLDRARQLAESLIASGTARRIPFDQGRGHWLLGEVLARSGDPDLALRELDAALALLAESSRIDCPGVLATRAALYLRLGRATEALAAAEAGLSWYETAGGSWFFRGPRLRLVHAECLAATGQRDAAHRAIAGARDRVLAIAAQIADPEYRASFLEQVPENRRTLDLTREWLGPDQSPKPQA